MPRTCLAISSESLTTSTSLAPRAQPRAKPSSSASYSATLLVTRPSSSEASSRTSPFAEEPILAQTAGPGLPREPPSTWTTTLILAPRARRNWLQWRPLRAVDERRQIACDTGATAVADHAALHLALGRLRTARATVGLAAVDDDCDVVVA